MWGPLRIDIYHHLASGSADRKLDTILARLEKLMAGDVELNARFDRMQAALTKVAEDVRRLAASIGTGMTQAEVDAANTRAEQIATALETLDAQTPEP